MVLMSMCLDSRHRCRLESCLHRPTESPQRQTEVTLGTVVTRLALGQMGMGMETGMAWAMMGALAEEPVAAVAEATEVMGMTGIIITTDPVTRIQEGRSWH